MALMEIVGFIPSKMADLIVVPKEITKQMGSDFDVDKLFVYKRHYVYANGKLNVANKGNNVKL